MFLKSLTLHGFKTFADETEIVFNPDSHITAVVGPNGCGKSNLLDSIRWVLGEENPRLLRVGALENIIFAGTANRKPLSLAEVSIFFDNAAGKLPIPYTEVSIRRRTFRSGESDFSINKSFCRLKDIRDLLMDTGLGEGTYAIITQGQVDSILSSKGEERRVVFEEAAGINKYKTRKLAAEKKLIAAEQNLLRINDLKIEVNEHLITLEEQARKAHEYLAIQSRVKEIEIGLSKKLLASIIEKKIKLEEELKAAKQAGEVRLAEEIKYEETLNTLKELLRKSEIEIEELYGNLDAEKDRLRDLEVNRRFLEGEISREERLLTEIEAKKASLAKKIADLSSSEALNFNDDPPPKIFREDVASLIEQTRHLIGLLSTITFFLGGKEFFTLTDPSERETARAFKLELLQGEAAKEEQELERIRFSLHAHHAEIEGLSPEVGKPEAKVLLLDNLNKLKQEREKTKSQIIELEEKVRLEEKNERAVAAAATTIEIAIAKLDGELAALGEKLFTEYNLTLAEIEPLSPEVSNMAKAKNEVEAGKSRLRALEPVNLLAIEEFDKTQERLSFIEAQLTDLGSARENLHNLIRELDLKAEETFIQTMQQLSLIFSETFGKLFSGGEAKIELAPDLPALEAPIEISVRPSGRRWLPLTLLSGGERSLCAIAILFSLLKIRPSPFCFLDEVDAALDEANLGRFTEMLKTFSSATQIVVITHNKRTMAAADNIYGVTMQEPGTSSIISMKLTGAAV